MYIGVIFKTAAGVDITGLTPTINIYNAITKALLISGGTVDEIAEGGYRYTFSTYDPTIDYYWKIDGGAAITNNNIRYKRGFSGLANMAYEEENVNTYAEPGQGAPPATTSRGLKRDYMYKFWRNKNTRDSAGQMSIYNDTGNVVDQKATATDDGTTFTKTEYESGP